MGLENLLSYRKSMYNKQGKIVVIGQSETKINKLLAVAKELGFDKNRFEFYLDYNEGSVAKF